MFLVFRPRPPSLFLSSCFEQRLTRVVVGYSWSGGERKKELIKKSWGRRMGLNNTPLAIILRSLILSLFTDLASLPSFVPLPSTPNNSERESERKGE